MQGDGSKMNRYCLLKKIDLWIVAARYFLRRRSFKVVVCMILVCPGRSIGFHPFFVIDTKPFLSERFDAVPMAKK